MVVVCFNNLASPLLDHKIKSIRSMMSHSEAVSRFTCPVCEYEHSELYQVSKCEHRFCLHCSLAYISSQANNFATARCLQEGCLQALDKQLPIYGKIDAGTAKKLAQFETFQFLQKNNKYRSCKKRDCGGVFVLKQKRCQICQSLHCGKCAEMWHKGKCVETREDIEMVQLHYRRCPNCRVWVEKSQGCQYINCKCGTQFCYSCGNLFDNDPCRMKEAWSGEAQMRELMAELVRCPTTIKSACSLPLKIMVYVLVTMMSLLVAFVVLVLASCLTVVVISLAFPATLCQPISEIKSSCCRNLSIALLIFGYPLIVVFAASMLVSMLLVYPFCRRCNHHGVFDVIDMVMFRAAALYLKLTQCIFRSD